MIFAVVTDSKGQVVYGSKWNDLDQLKHWLETPTQKLEKWEQIAVFNLDSPNGHSPVVKRARRNHEKA